MLVRYVPSIFSDIILKTILFRGESKKCGLSDLNCVSVYPYVHCQRLGVLPHFGICHALNPFSRVIGLKTAAALQYMGQFPRKLPHG